MSGVGSQGSPVEGGEKVICDIMSAEDRKKEFTWAEINGVRRVTLIKYTSETVNAAQGDDYEFTKTFVYQGADPYDLIRIDEALTVVP